MKNEIVVSSIALKSKQQQNQNLIFAKIDSVSLSQIKRVENKNETIFDYYKTETVDEVEIWSGKMFGRCCTEADLSYSELLEFEITTNKNNTAYPYRNLSDRAYRSAYVFKENQNIEIVVKLNRTNKNHLYHTNLTIDEILQPNDTILMPFRLSLINGYVKSEVAFKQNGRVKTMEVFLNDNYKATIQLLDTPLVQEFAVDVLFTKNDVIKLVPKSYYAGSKYEDICISEIQTSLSAITCHSFNEKFSLQRGSFTYFGDSAFGSVGKWEQTVLGYNQVKIREQLKPVEKMIWKAYYQNCRLACKVEYHNGKLMNILSYFDRNGNVLDQGSIKDGNGTVKEYDKNGKLVKETTFRSGLIVE